jgi:hypothetical protein
MKKKSLILKMAYWMLVGTGLVFAATSCKKYNSEGFTPGKGVPTISSVHTWNKVDTTTAYDTIFSYDANGNLVTTLKLKQTRVNPFDSATTAGNLGTYYIIYGSNLGATTGITFNGYSAYFNRALITDNSIVVQVPSKTPYYGPQATDSLVITTLYGQAYYKFTILPPPPTPESYSNYNYQPSVSSASEITIKGVGFASVTSVDVAAATGSATGTTSIVSQNDSVMTLKFNSSTVERGNLVFTYDLGGNSVTIKAPEEVVNLDNTTRFITDNIESGWGSWSWGPAGMSTNQAKTGTASFGAQYGANSWWIDGIRMGGGGATDGIPYSPDYKYLSFWVHGGAADQKIYIEFGGGPAAGFNQNQVTDNQYDVPAGVWTYFKIPIANLVWNNISGSGNWADNSTQLLNTVAFFMNSNSAAEQLYFDDVILVK